MKHSLVCLRLYVRCSVAACTGSASSADACVPPSLARYTPLKRCRAALRRFTSNETCVSLHQVSLALVGFSLWMVLFIGTRLGDFAYIMLRLCMVLHVLEVMLRVFADGWGAFWFRTTRLRLERSMKQRETARRSAAARHQGRERLHNEEGPAGPDGVTQRRLMQRRQAKYETVANRFDFTVMLITVTLFVCSWFYRVRAYTYTWKHRPRALCKASDLLTCMSTSVAHRPGCRGLAEAVSSAAGPPPVLYRVQHSLHCVWLAAALPPPAATAHGLGRTCARQRLLLQRLRHDSRVCGTRMWPALCVQCIMYEFAILGTWMFGGYLVELPDSVYSMKGANFTSFRAAMTTMFQVRHTRSGGCKGREAVYETNVHGVVCCRC